MPRKLWAAENNRGSSIVGDLLQLLGDVLGNMISGHRSKSIVMRWLGRAVMLVLVTLIALVIYRMQAH